MFELTFYFDVFLIKEKKGGPPSKPKYNSMTDSEQVPWGKGEKNPKKGSEIESLKFDANNQSKLFLKD